MIRICRGGGGDCRGRADYALAADESATLSLSLVQGRSGKSESTSTGGCSCHGPGLPRRYQTPQGFPTNKRPATGRPRCARRRQPSPPRGRRAGTPRRASRTPRRRRRRRMPLALDERVPARPRPLRVHFAARPARMRARSAARPSSTRRRKSIERRDVLGGQDPRHLRARALGAQRRRAVRLRFERRALPVELIENARRAGPAILAVGDDRRGVRLPDDGRVAAAYQRCVLVQRAQPRPAAVVGEATP